MVAFQIRINGESYCDPDDEITTVTIFAEHLTRRDIDRVSIHAASADYEKLEWLGAHLGVGDEIQIRIVEVAETTEAAVDACDFCGRSLHELEKIVRGSDVSICDACVTGFAATVRGGARLPIGASIRDGADQVCGFCRNRSGIVAGVVVRNGAAICPECLRACEEIMSMQ